MVGGLCLATMQPSFSAEVQPGFYFGVGAGESSFDLEKSEFDIVTLSVLRSRQFFIISNASTFEDSDTSLSLFAGYQFNPFISVEAGYVDLGAAEYRSTATVNPPGPIASLPTTLNVDVESTGFTLAGLGRLPLGSAFDLHGRLGFFFSQTDLTVTGNTGPDTSSETRTLDSIGGFYSVGGGFTFGQHWSLSLDWTRYDNVGDENEDDDARTEAGFDVDALSFSAMFRF